MIKEDEYLERIVAGIYSLTSDAAEVRWDEKIGGRQFDVTMRFNLAGLDFLVLVEVKNHKRAVTAALLEAFVTKARDHGANKLVFVSAAGYQSAAIEVAKRHGVSIYRTEFLKDSFQVNFSGSTLHVKNRELEVGEVPHFSVGDLQVGNNIIKMTLVYSNGRHYELPTESTQFEYYLQKSTFEDGKTLSDVVYAASVPAKELGASFEYKLDLSTKRNFFQKKVGKKIKPPDEWYFPEGDVTELKLDVEVIEIRHLEGNIGFEPTTISNPVRYVDILNNVATDFPVSQLPLGLQNATTGNYYFQLFPLRYFYCESVNGATVYWRMIESFQSGTSIRASYTQDEMYSKYYIPVTSKADLDRLAYRLEQYFSDLRRDAGG